MKKAEKPTFRAQVLKIVAAIPKGETLSYGDVAWLAGSPGAARAVGNIMKTNFDPKIPCHRVVRSDGKPGAWNRGAENKARLLKKEGAYFPDGTLKTDQRVVRKNAHLRKSKV